MKGVTLIELLVASTILVMVIGATLSSFVAYQRIVLRNGIRQEAISIIDNDFELISSLVNSGTNSIVLLNEQLSGFEVSNAKFISDDNVTYDLKYVSTPYEVIVAAPSSSLNFKPALLNITATMTWKYLGNNEKLVMNYLTKAERRD